METNAEQERKFCSGNDLRVNAPKSQVVNYNKFFEGPVQVTRTFVEVLLPTRECGGWEQKTELN